MRNQNAFFTDRLTAQNRQQHWDAFCQNGTVEAYLAYRACCEPEEAAYADTSDRQGAGHPGDAIPGFGQNL
ncbi:MAG: hypothetical protein MJ065_04280 [Oscillospiraceae bacterium]|nr:hypothetical protein [Oscillospiraceae bacterium]